MTDDRLHAPAERMRPRLATAQGRQSRILELLHDAAEVRVADLSLSLEVSAVTVRKDLDALARRGLLVRNRGGAVLPSRRLEGSFYDRLGQDARSKRSIATAAARLVRDGDVIAFDSSTTSYAIAHQLLGRRNLTVITQSLEIALLLLHRSDAEVSILGGDLRRSTAGVVNPSEVPLRARPRIGFFGCTGLTNKLELLEAEAEEAAAKRALLAACKDGYGVFAASKLRGFGAHRFARPRELRGVITATTSEKFLQRWRDLDVDVVCPILTRADDAA